MNRLTPLLLVLLSACEGGDIWKGMAAVGMGVLGILAAVAFKGKGPNRSKTKTNLDRDIERDKADREAAAANAAANAAEATEARVIKAQVDADQGLTQDQFDELVKQYNEIKARRG